MSSHTKALLLSIPAAILAGAAIFWWQRNRKQSFYSVGHVVGMYIYPVKSCKGIPLKSAKCLFEGLQHDRRWVVVDKKNRVLTPTYARALVLVSPHFDDNMKNLCLDAPGMDTLKIPLTRKTDQVKEIEFLGMVAEGVYIGDEAADWITTYLNRPGCKMYHVTKPRYLKEHPEWGDRGRTNDRTAFANTTSVMISSQSSLEEVNKHYDFDVVMQRFRPNVIVDGGKPYDEDLWRRVKIGDDVHLRFVKECGRCPSINVDPITGERSTEPLHTLKRVRSVPGADLRYRGSPWFGWCCAPDTEGQISIGDPVFAARG